MYKSIYVPVDNSDHSNRAVTCAIDLGKAFDAKLVGCHVYAAKLHDYRFRQMEYTLPEEYIDEVELERQRKIHDSLITMGLKLISDSYLDGMSKVCAQSGLAFEPRMMDGKHHIEILRDLAGSAHQRLAEICEDVFFVAAGLPLTLKGGGEVPRVHEA